MFIKLSQYLVQLLFFNNPINCTNNILSMMCKIYLFEYKFNKYCVRHSKTYKIKTFVNKHGKTFVFV